MFAEMSRVKTAEISITDSEITIVTLNYFQLTPASYIKIV